MENTAAGPVNVPKTYQSSLSTRTSRVLGRLATHAVLLVGSMIFAIPFIWMLSTSLKSDRQIFAWPPVWIPNPAGLG